LTPLRSAAYPVRTKAKERPLAGAPLRNVSLFADLVSPPR
jgi:hypothetical protein